MKLLITGSPGIGKTTLLKEIIEQAGNISFAGFYTQEIRDHRGKREGFQIVSLDGVTDIFASVHYKTLKRVSKYGVDIKKFESVAIPSLQKGIEEGQFLVIDEIGKMELFSKKFKQLLVDIFRRKYLNLIGVVMRYPNRFVKELIEKPDVEVFNLTRANYKEIPKEILGKILRENL